MTQSEFETTSVDPADGDLVHSGGKVGAAGESLADDDSTQEEKSDAGKKLEQHQEDFHGT